MTSEELLRVYSQAAFTTDVPPDGCDMPIFHRTALLAVAEAAAREALEKVRAKAQAIVTRSACAAAEAFNDGHITTEFFCGGRQSAANDILSALDDALRAAPEGGEKGDKT